MMTRSELDHIRARIADLAAQARAGLGQAADVDTAATALELADIAVRLHGELERARMAAHAQHMALLELLAAARATLAAAHQGEARLAHLEHALAAHGWLPDPGASPERILADAAALETALATAGVAA